MNKDLVALSELHFKYLRFVQELTERGVITGVVADGFAEQLSTIHSGLDAHVIDHADKQVSF